jgi:hypothetical protein
VVGAFMPNWYLFRQCAGCGRWVGGCFVYLGAGFSAEVDCLGIAQSGECNCVGPATITETGVQ